MNALIGAIRIIGSVGLFLYGMKLMSDGLQKSAGSKLKSILKAMTANRFMAVLTGTLLTMVIQSSSAVTVMVVSFVSASLMTLSQSIGVILGANIGTTITSWIVSLLGFEMDITILALASVALSLPFLFSKKPKRREISEIFLGFGFLFLGLNFLQRSMPNVGDHPEILSFLQSFNNSSIISLLICVLVGALITCIVQASAATMAITITMAYQGWIGIWSAAALCLGQNIGTTITAFVASLSTGTNGKRAALAHTLFNVVGSVLALIFFKPLINLVNLITPGNIFLSQGEALNKELPIFLSMFHTVFNLINTLLFLPFTTQFARLIEKMIPEKEKFDDGTYHFRYIGNSRVDTPEIYLIQVKEEIDKMGALTRNMFQKYMAMCFKTSDISEDIEVLKKDEDYADQMQEQLIDFCVRMLQDSQSPTNASTLQKLIRIIDETESITDSIFNMAKLNETKRKDDLHFSEEAKAELKTFNELTYSFVEEITNRIGERMNARDMTISQNLERDINDKHRELRATGQNNLMTESENVKSDLLYLEIIRHLEHIGDFCLNIAETRFALQKHTPSLIQEEKKAKEVAR